MHRLLCLLLFASLLPAQNHLIPSDQWFLRIELRNLPAMQQGLEQSALGALYRADEVVEAFAAMRQAHQAASSRQRQLEDYCRSRSLLAADELLMRAFFGLDPADFDDFTLSVFYDKQSEQPWPTTLATLTPRPRVEGRLAAECQQLCNDLAASIDAQRVGEQKLGGFPADVFGPRDTGEDRSNLPEQYGRFSILHLPGQFVHGTGEPHKHASFGQRPQPAAEPLVQISLRFSAMPGGDAEVQQVGLDNHGAMTLSMRLVGQLLQGEAAVDIAPAGPIDAMVSGKAKLPRQPLPDGALLQLRLAADLGTLLQVVQPLLQELGIAGDLRPQLAIFDGGIAIGAAAPAPGSVIPRLYLSLGLADPQAFAALLQGLPQGDGAPKLEARKFAGRDGTLVRFPDLPAGLQPCFCIVAGTLHAAESPQSLTQLLRNLESDRDAMDIGEAPLPAGQGEILPNFDLRYDLAAAYRAYHKVWLQPARLLVMAEASSMFFPTQLLLPLVDADILPSPEVIDEHLRPGRAVMRRQGNRLLYQELSPLGGPLLTPTFGLYAAAFLSRFDQASGWRMQQLVQRVEKHQLEQLATALQKHQQLAGRKAQSLAELAAAGLLADDALLLPDDATPDAVLFTDKQGRRRTLQTSFRFVPKGVAVKSYEGESTLVAVRRPGPAAEAERPGGFVPFGNLVFLDADGAVRAEYGDDDFRNAVRRAGMTEAEQKLDQEAERAKPGPAAEARAAAEAMRATVEEAMRAAKEAERKAREAAEAEQKKKGGG